MYYVANWAVSPWSVLVHLSQLIRGFEAHILNLELAGLYFESICIYWLKFRNKHLYISFPDPII
jgi:hypothetical protein